MTPSAPQVFSDVPLSIIGVVLGCIVYLAAVFLLAWRAVRSPRVPPETAVKPDTVKKEAP